MGDDYGGYDPTAAPSFPSQGFQQPQFGQQQQPSTARLAGEAIGTVLGAAITNAMSNRAPQSAASVAPQVPAGPPQTMVRVCNKSDSKRIHVSIAYATPNFNGSALEWVSKGRFITKRNKCSDIALPEISEGKPYQYTTYLYARTVNTDDVTGAPEKEWTGPTFSMCVNTTAPFEYRGANQMDCNGDGLTKVGAIALEARPGGGSRYDFTD
ncbi:MAG: DUF1036 domain-containing protein [Pseudomonadota bacterium]